jgi:hypothetical protein
MYHTIKSMLKHLKTCEMCGKDSKNLKKVFYGKYVSAMIGKEESDCCSKCFKEYQEKISTSFDLLIVDSGPPYPSLTRILN